MTLENGKRATISNYRMFNLLNLKSEDEIHQYSLDKKYRLNYFDIVNKFYNDLKQMCEKLKEFPKDSKDKPNNTRNEVLKKYIMSFNAAISLLDKDMEDVANPTVRGFYKGYILPFDDSQSTMDDCNTMIVNILPEYSFCFSTKARVPVKITVETIKVLECVYWDELYMSGDIEEGIRKYSSVEEFFMTIDNEDTVCKLN
jgi:hypothetical protein